MRATPDKPPSPFKYYAFISYSHRDRKWADWLHKRLETFAVPKTLVGSTTVAGEVPKRLFPVFRDREELPTSSALSDNIDAALESSRFLVVICSPRSAGSLWVNEEIKSFKAKFGEERVLCLIVDGEPNASDKPELDGEECFPEAIRYRVGADRQLTDERTEPIAADARPHADGRDDAKLKLVAGLLGVGFNDLKRREHKRRQRQMLIVTAGMTVIAGTMTVLALSAWFGWKKAERQELLALETRDQAERIATTMLFDFRDKLEPLGQLNLLKENAVVVRDYYLQLPEEHRTSITERRRGSALMNVGDVLDVQGEYEEARRAFEESEQIFTRLREAEPDNVEAQRSWTVIANRIADQHLALGELQLARTQYEQSAQVSASLLDKAPGDGQLRRDVIVVAIKLGRLLEQIGEHELAFGQFSEALELARGGIEKLPSNKQNRIDLAVVLDSLADLHQLRGERSQALELMAEVLSLDRRLAEDFPSDFLRKQALAKALGRTADLEFDAGQLASARELQTERWEILEALVAHDPTNNRWQRSRVSCFVSLARITEVSGDLPAARARYVEGIEMFEQLANARPDDLESQFDLAVAHERLGDADFNANAYDQALESYTAARTITIGLVRRSDASERWVSAAASYYGKVGQTMMEVGQYAEAVDALHVSTGLSEELLDADPDNREYRRNLSIALTRLGSVERRAGNLEAAAQSYHRSVALDQLLLDDQPDDSQAVRDLAISRSQLGRTYQLDGQNALARTEYEAALELRRRLLSLAPSNISIRGDLYESMVALGDSHSADSDYDTARAYYMEARDGYLSWSEESPADASVRREAAVTHNRLGQSYSLESRGDLALPHYEAAYVLVKQLAEENPDNVVWQTDYVISLRVLSFGVTLPRATALEYNRTALEILERLDADGVLNEAFRAWIAPTRADIERLSQE